MAFSSNSNAGSTEPKVGAGALSNFTGNKSGGATAPVPGATTSNPTGNFPGGDINFKLGINNPFDTKEPQQPTFNTDDVFKPTVSGNLDIDLPKTNNNSSSSSNTTYSNNSSEPTMTVDEVYGKTENAFGTGGNQSIVEKQGDYTASSNEKSEVETSTFGKQDNITVTPVSVTENKGLVGNAAIQSVEGLDFQQKDKESQDVMEAKKSRDEVEAEDKANQMRDSLKAKTEENLDKEVANDFQIGEKNTFEEQSKARLNKLNKLKNDLNEVNKNLEEAKSAKIEADKKVEEAKQNYQEVLYEKDQISLIAQDLTSSLEQLNADPLRKFLAKTGLDKDENFDSLKSGVIEMAESYGIEIGDLSKANSLELMAANVKVTNKVLDICEQDLKNAENELTVAQKQQKDLEANQNVLMSKQQQAQAEYTKAKQEYNTWKTEYWTNTEKSEVEDLAAAKAKADKAEKAYKDLQAKVDEKKAEYNAAKKNLSKANVDYFDANTKLGKTNVDLDDLQFETITLSDGQEVSKIIYTGNDPAIKAKHDARNEAVQNLVQADLTYAEKKSEWDNYINATNNAKEQADKAKADYNSMLSETSTENTLPDIKQTFDSAIQNAVENGADAETVQTMTDIATSIVDTQAKMKQAIERNDIPAYIKYQGQYGENLKKALGIGNAWTQTNSNKEFVAAVAEANDFNVTLADGTQTTYSKFATDMVTKSPEIAKAMYEAKADDLEANGHKVLAKIERMKAAMAGTWLGSKLTFADNQVRNQFNQMAETNMRATYATHNNVLNNPNATPEEKAKAFEAIEQARLLKTASAALQASTGFFNGIGDGTADGEYGTTNPETLNAWQKTLNTVDNVIKITLGLGITPGANKAYQNMYYMAGDKVNDSFLFNKDFDGDGFALCQEYGNNAATYMIAAGCELAAGVALVFNPATYKMGLNLIVDSINTYRNGLYEVRNAANKSLKYTQEVLEYFKEAENIAESSGNEEAVQEITNAITQIENFELKSDEVGNLDNWLEGSGSNTATNEKFNQSLSYDEWLKLIEADPTMQEYAKKLIAEKKEK